jgi:hypothetical protein
VNEPHSPWTPTVLRERRLQSSAPCSGLSTAYVVYVLLFQLFQRHLLPRANGFFMFLLAQSRNKSKSARLFVPSIFMWV